MRPHDATTDVEPGTGPSLLAAAAGSPVPASAELHAHSLRARLRNADDLEAQRPPQPVVDGILDRRNLAAVFGPSGAGKSFLCIGMAAAVASGTSWFGRETERGPVLYVAAEGSAGMPGRVAAWRDHHGVALDCFSLIEGPVDLRDPGQVHALVEVAQEDAVDLIVIDTLAASMAGADENSSRDMAAIVDGLRTLTEASPYLGGTAVVVVHHAGKVRAGMRGSSVLLAALDVALEVKGQDDRVTATVVKSRERAGGDVIRGRLIPVGESAVVVDDGATITAGTLTGADLDLLRTLAEVDSGTGASATVWQTSSSVAKATFYRRKVSLLQAGLVSSVSPNGRGPYRLSRKGSAAAGLTSLTEVSPRISPEVSLVSPTPIGVGSETETETETETNQTEERER